MFPVAVVDEGLIMLIVSDLLVKAFICATWKILFDKVVV